MLIDVVSRKKDGINGELCQLANFLEKFPFYRKDHLVFVKNFALEERKVFDSLFDPIYQHYQECIKSYGLDKFIKIVKRIEPLIIFMVKKDDEIDIASLVTQVILFDMNHYFYKADDFISIANDKYAVHQKLGLSRDKYNLVQVNNRFALQRQGIIYINKHLIFYHPFLRRYFTSNFTEITSYINELSRLKNITLKLGIDPFRINKKEYLIDIIELDYWWGPKFNKQKLDDKNFIGKTVYKRVDNNNNLNWPVDRIEVNITGKEENKKSITIEEINPPIDLLNTEEKYVIGKHFLEYSKQYRFNKFAHFIWDKKRKCFSHLDVSVIVYDLQKFQERFDSNFPDKNKVHKVDKIKLIEIDGFITLDIVQKLIGDFFRYNELTSEFFQSK